VSTDGLVKENNGSAVLQGPYRYRLSRWTGEREYDDPALLWIMLNPSTADALTDDQTIRKVSKFSRALSFERFIVINLFAMRATDPADLIAAVKDPDRADSPVGPEWQRYLAQSLRQSEGVVVAWGGTVERLGAAGRRQVKRTLEHIWAYGHEPLCLGTTKSGQPRHPSRVGYSQRAVHYTPPSGWKDWA